MGNPVVGERHDTGEEREKCEDRTDWSDRCQGVLFAGAIDERGTG